MRIGFAVGIVCAAAIFAVTARAAPAASELPVLTVAQFKASPPVGKIVRIAGTVVDTYLCPPCPTGAMCKPCMSVSSVFVSDAPNAPAMAIAVADPAQFERGRQYRFEIVAVARAPEGVDGRMLRSQRADEPVWTTPPP